MSFRSEQKKRTKFASEADVTDNGRTAAKQPPDPDRCPSGWDENIWHLTLLFEQKAAEDEIQLAVRRPIIYSKLRKALETSGIPDIPVPYPDDKLQLAFEFLAWCNYTGERPHQLLEVPVYTLTGPRWRKVVELYMIEFWTRYWDEYALDSFCEIDGKFGLSYQHDKFEERMGSLEFKRVWKVRLAQGTVSR